MRSANMASSVYLDSPESPRCAETDENLVRSQEIVRFNSCPARSRSVLRGVDRNAETLRVRHERSCEKRKALQGVFVVDEKSLPSPCETTGRGFEPSHTHPGHPPTNFEECALTLGISLSHVLSEMAESRIPRRLAFLLDGFLMELSQSKKTGVRVSAMVCLKGIPKNLSPELLHTLASMGHGDEIVLADANFPASSTCRHGPKEIRADGLNVPELLSSILKLFPLDTYEAPVYLMDLEKVDKERKLPTPVWKEYEKIVNAAEGKEIELTKLERFEFYEKAKKAYAVVATSESALYGNIILKKGVIS